MMKEEMERNQKLKMEELRKIKGLEDLTEKEASEALESIDKLCYILIKMVNKEYIEKNKPKKAKQKGL